MSSSKSQISASISTPPAIESTVNNRCWRVGVSSLSLSLSLSFSVRVAKPLSVSKTNPRSEHEPWTPMVWRRRVCGCGWTPRDMAPRCSASPLSPSAPFCQPWNDVVRPPKDIHLDTAVPSAAFDRNLTEVHPSPLP